MKTLLTLLIFATTIPAARADYCKPYVTHTCFVSSHTECRWDTTPCGQRYSYEVKIVTYRSYYSDGHTNTFSKTSRI